MALDDILAALRHEAEQEVARIAAERDASLTQIIDAARREAERVEADAAAARDDRLGTEAAVIRNRASLHVERRVQEERESIYQEILRRARDRLAARRRDPSYRSTMRALVSECFDALPDAEVVMTAPVDSPLVAELVAELGATAEVESSLDTCGGVEACSAGGAFVRNTFEERLERSGARLRRMVGDLVSELRGGSTP